MTHLLENRIAFSLAQINPIVGDIDGNMEKARAARRHAAETGADLLVLPELFVSGYPPEDLVLKPAFQEACRTAVEALALETGDGGPGVLIGSPWVKDGALWNAVCLLDNGRVEQVQGKVELPNYGVFDEVRVFDKAPLPGPMGFRGIRLGAPICEDIWFDQVSECLMETGAEILVVPNGSPYACGKSEQRMQVAVARVVETELPLIYLNQLGGQDELVFDGASFGLNADRTLAFQMAAFQDQQALVVMERDGESWRCTSGPMEPLPDTQEETWRACVLGLRDYVNKTGFPGVVLGLSGGIDSAVCAAMAVDALGAERVHCIMLPYRYTSGESLSDAAGCADALGVRYDTIPIEKPVEGFTDALQSLFTDTQADTTEENLQSRARGTILMAVSNKFGSMVVTTGNKSEVSVGYATLYGDMNGGFNPIKDLYKTEVYALARWRNTHQPEGLLGPGGGVIPINIIDKAPTAELRENQTDQDSLPDYAVLDDILTGLVEEERSLDELIAKGHDRPVVERIQHLLYIAEYKRRQAAPGVRVTDKNFGKDRRYPITNRYRDRVKG